MLAYLEGVETQPLKEPHNDCTTSHLYIDLYRSRERQNTVHSGLQKEAAGAIAHQPTPEANLLKNELVDYLSQLTSDLLVRLREPLILRFYQEKSYKEVAFQLGITEATGRKRIQQARMILRKQLTCYLAGDSNAKILTTMHDETRCNPNAQSLIISQLRSGQSTTVGF
ncbi:MAG: RNA polymerase sigma factor [Phormidesmis sp.]